MGLGLPPLHQNHLFLAVFKELEKIFQNEKDSAVPYYIFMMTDGEDTCNNNAEIMLAKEHLQTCIERFGGKNQSMSIG